MKLDIRKNKRGLWEIRITHPNSPGPGSLIGMASEFSAIPYVEEIYRRPDFYYPAKGQGKL
jgi:hypothetical protein